MAVRKDGSGIVYVAVNGSVVKIGTVLSVHQLEKKFKDNPDGLKLIAYGQFEGALQVAGDIRNLSREKDYKDDVLGVTEKFWDYIDLVLQFTFITVLQGDGTLATELSRILNKPNEA